MNSIAAQKKALSDCGKPKHIRKYIDRDRIVRLWTESVLWTQQDIADICRCSIGAVRRVLREEGFEEVITLYGGYTFKRMRRYRVGENPGKIFGAL